MDPRTSVIQERLNKVKRIIPVASSKGGVGKSLISTCMALMLARNGKKTGLLDLDLHSPSDHVILGAKNQGLPEEKNGILPYEIKDIKFMSIVYFTDDKPGAFRGVDITNIITELLAITQWGDLDYLIIDMPPGLGEETLDVVNLVKRGEFLVVTTYSKIALRSVEKLLEILKTVKIPILGVVENMKITNSSIIEKTMRDKKISYLGGIRFDMNVENAIGKPENLLHTRFMTDLEKIIHKIS